MSAITVAPGIFAGVPFYDVRAEQVKAHPKTRVRAGRTVVRDPKDVTGVVIHQTAVRYGLSDDQLLASSGDRRLAFARRGLNVACHAIAFREGLFAAVRPLEHYVLHGNGFNGYTLGLEIDGLYAGLLDDPETIPIREDLATIPKGRMADEINATILAAAKAALFWLVTEGARVGMNIRDVYAHRQSSGTRRADPGEGWWVHLVLDYAVRELGLRTHPEVWLPSRLKGRPNNGRPIPREWDPAGVGAYWQRP